ncbi:biotin--[acetyl-CoA-carboxylase] ligase [Enterovirga aerilata]|uniref:biotin--[biotin carboxyl-carrier protein] ligase n=1 Tax=Enterovirga aerilata TaxID=2730920 RepID=A0A849I7G5_9HYPH|nr:biotin--[acetyl-CoA-carboxylase] ligase [Enterovirga sp. DB1703]NNM72339.1 biotin--[acetyl-CoA-carboxylase] ligase [Enterovirga sp. DB1703]
MAFALAPEAAASGYGLVAHETIGSTNVDAMARLHAGAPAPFWVVSRHQNQGRGRRGAAWETQAGNLAASLALTTRAEPAVVATLGFVAGLALVRALDAVCALPSPLAGEGGPGVSRGRMRGEDGAGDPSSVVPSGRHLLPQGEKEGRRFRLKWPNDVLADGAKLAGILLETETLGEARAVVIGIGVNVAHSPKGLPYPVASLRSLGHAVGPEELFTRLSAEWVETAGIWDEGRDFDAIRDLWLARAAGLGEPIFVRSGTIVTSGTFETIDGHGQLVLRTAEGEIRTISAGEVHFGTAATARPEVAA